MPHNFEKPRFPQVHLRSLNADLDQLQRLLQASTDENGVLDLQGLEQRAEATGNESLTEAVEAIRSERAFFREEDRVVTGCNGDREVVRMAVRPDTLNADEVVSVVEALRQAKENVDDLDRNDNHLIDPFEADGAEELPGLSGDIAGATVHGKLGDYRRALRRWQVAVSEALDDLDQRQSFHEQIDRLAEFHTASPEAAEAVRWHFHALATSGEQLDYWEVRDRLEDAEYSFLAFLPRFLRPDNAREDAENHLSDGEVRRMLRTDDLVAYAGAKKAEAIENAGEWDEYLAGRGRQPIAGIEKRDDPDFVRVRSGC